jgi:hypothetical protein
MLKKTVSSPDNGIEFPKCVDEGFPQIENWIKC